MSKRCDHSILFGDEGSKKLSQKLSEGKVRQELR